MNLPINNADALPPEEEAQDNQESQNYLEAQEVFEKDPRFQEQGFYYFCGSERFPYAANPARQKRLERIVSDDLVHRSKFDSQLLLVGHDWMELSLRTTNMEDLLLFFDDVQKQIIQEQGESRNIPIYEVLKEAFVNGYAVLPGDPVDPDNTYMNLGVGFPFALPIGYIWDIDAEGHRVIRSIDQNTIPQIPELLASAYERTNTSPTELPGFNILPPNLKQVLFFSRGSYFEHTDARKRLLEKLAEDPEAPIDQVILHFLVSQGDSIGNRVIAQVIEPGVNAKILGLNTGYGNELGLPFVIESPQFMDPIIGREISIRYPEVPFTERSPWDRNDPVMHWSEVSSGDVISLKTAFHPKKPRYSVVVPGNFGKQTEQ